MSENNTTALDDLKALWLNNRERQKFNPLMREIREIIRKYDPQWDDQMCLANLDRNKMLKRELGKLGPELKSREIPDPPKPKFDIVMPGANKPTST